LIYSNRTSGEMRASRIKERKNTTVKGIHPVCAARKKEDKKMLGEKKRSGRSERQEEKNLVKKKQLHIKIKDLLVL